MASLSFYFSEDVSAADNDRALEILRHCEENLKVTDRFQYKIKTLCSNQFPPAYSNSYGVSLSVQNIEGLITKDGNKIDIVTDIKTYRDSKLFSDEKFRHVATPVFFATGFNGGDSDSPYAGYAGMVTTEQAKENLPILLSVGQYGFELDGYLVYGVRIPELMLAESDCVRYIGGEDINGFMCQHIKADTKYGLFSVYIDTNNNYIVRKFGAITRQSDVWYDKKHGKQPDFQNVDDDLVPDIVDTWTLTLDGLEFIVIDGIRVPTKGTLRAIRQDKNGDVYTSKSEFERTNIVLNPTFGKDVFSADFLKGEVVSNLDDIESGVVYMWDGEKCVPAYTMLEGSARMSGYAGFVRLATMLVGIALIVYALCRMYFKAKIGG